MLVDKMYFVIGLIVLAGIVFGISVGFNLFRRYAYFHSPYIHPHYPVIADNNNQKSKQDDNQFSWTSLFIFVLICSALFIYFAKNVEGINIQVSSGATSKKHSEILTQKESKSNVYSASLSTTKDEKLNVSKSFNSPAVTSGERYFVQLLCSSHRKKIEEVNQQYRRNLPGYKLCVGFKRPSLSPYTSLVEFSTSEDAHKFRAEKIKSGAIKANAFVVEESKISKIYN